MNLANFPRTHLLMVGALLALMMIVLALPERGIDLPADDARLAELLAAGAIPAAGGSAAEPETRTAENSSAREQDAPAEADNGAVRAAELINDPPTAERTATMEVRSGDTLSAIFSREGLSSRDLHLLMTSEPLGQRLRNIFPGQAMHYTVDGDGTLLRFEYPTSALQTLVFSRHGGQFIAKEINRDPERIAAYRRGVIENSLFLASQRAGLNDTMTMRLAQIFQWDIDFVLDIRRGDEFAVLFEELYLDGDFIGYGNILAAEFVNRGRSYRAVRYTDSHGDTHYYTPEGSPMRQAFLRAPVEFSRISSNFNMNRRHPLFNRSMPHRGIDYAAPTGTPVLAAGDGRIVTAGRTDPSGNYIVIQHGSQVTTKYLHLHRFAPNIRQGVRIRQGQLIGYVGSTGWATGPHLHYEFLVNGVHQNPRTVKLPQAEPIPRTELAQFREHSVPLLALLSNHRQQQLALAQ